MKNPVTFSISDARKVQKHRQIKQIILLCSVILLLLGALLVIRVLTMKQEADQLFPVETTLSATGSVQTGTTAVIESTSTESSAAADTSEPDGTTAPDDTSAPDASTVPADTSADGTAPGDASADATPSPTPVSTTAPTLAPEQDVFIPESKVLQTTTHKVRDSAYHSLQKDVQALIDGQTGARSGFYYINLKNGEEFGYNDMVPFVVGSAINLPINIMLYDQARLGTISLSEIMTYEAGDTVSGSGSIQNTVVGSQHYIRELSNLSLTGSDNTAAAMIIRRLGGIDAINDNLKLISDVVDYRTITTYTDYANVQQSGMNRTSTQDLAKYMEYFYSKYLIDPAAYQPLFNDLAGTTADTGMSGGLSSDILICHKTGYNSVFKAQTDVALVFAEEPYVLCVSVECEDSAAGKLLMLQLSGMVYEYIHGCYT